MPDDRLVIYAAQIVYNFCRQRPIGKTDMAIAADIVQTPARIISLKQWPHSVQRPVQCPTMCERINRSEHVDIYGSVETGLSTSR